MSVPTSVDRHPGATSDELVARAVALQPLLRQHAAHGDDHRRQSDQVIAALTEAGLFRLLVPRRLGGHQANLRTLLEVTEALSEVDGSAAWVVSLGAVAGWLTGFGSERARHDVFAEDPDARIAGSLSPAPARRVEGGLRITGRWPHASGAPYATWALVGAMVPDDAGRQEVLLCLIPVADVAMEDTWHDIKYNAERVVHHRRWEAALANWDGPVQLVWGMDDPVSGRHVLERAIERLPRATVTELAGVGHFPQSEAPQSVAGAVRSATG